MSPSKPQGAGTLQDPFECLARPRNTAMGQHPPVKPAWYSLYSVQSTCHVLWSRPLDGNELAGQTLLTPLTAFWNRACGRRLFLLAAGDGKSQDSGNGRWRDKDQLYRWGEQYGKFCPPTSFCCARWDFVAALPIHHVNTYTT
jgi:hypothetical protein